MRIAVIADIHGNSFALEAVLEDISKQSVDEIVIAGDAVNLHPNSRRTWALLRSLGCVVLQGNHEQYMYASKAALDPTPRPNDQFGPTRWCAAQFSHEEKVEMEALPWAYKQPDLLIVHASQRDLYDNVDNTTSEVELQTLFPNIQASLIVRGHSHYWRERYWGHRRILTVNACGMPFGGNINAPYAILTHRESWTFEQHHVRYNHAAALEAIDETYLQQVGAVGLIFKRELETANEHIVPFLHKYKPHIEMGNISLTAAVERYLAEG